MLKINRDFLDLINLKNYHEIPVRFIKLYPHFFNSKYNKIDRHDSLGKNFIKLIQMHLLKIF